MSAISAHHWMWRGRFICERKGGEFCLIKTEISVPDERTGPLLSRFPSLNRISSLLLQACDKCPRVPVSWHAMKETRTWTHYRCACSQNGLVLTWPHPSTTLPSPFRCVRDTWVFCWLQFSICRAGLTPAILLLHTAWFHAGFYLQRRIQCEIKWLLLWGGRVNRLLHRDLGLHFL